MPAMHRDMALTGTLIDLSHAQKKQPAKRRPLLGQNRRGRAGLRESEA
jgi:hypothetical protein